MGELWALIPVDPDRDTANTFMLSSLLKSPRDAIRSWSRSVRFSLEPSGMTVADLPEISTLASCMASRVCRSVSIGEIPSRPRTSREDSIVLLASLICCNTASAYPTASPYSSCVRFRSNRCRNRVCCLPLGPTLTEMVTYFSFSVYRFRASAKDAVLGSVSRDTSSRSSCTAASPVVSDATKTFFP